MAVEVERAKLALAREQEDRAAERRRASHLQAQEYVVRVAKLLLQRVPRKLSAAALERFMSELELLTEESEPGSVGPVAVASLLVEVARSDMEPEGPPGGGVSPMLLWFMASKLGLL